MQINDGMNVNCITRIPHSEEGAHDQLYPFPHGPSTSADYGPLVVRAFASVCGCTDLCNMSLHLYDAITGQQRHMATGAQDWEESKRHIGVEVCFEARRGMSAACMGKVKYPLAVFGPIVFSFLTVFSPFGVTLIGCGPEERPLIFGFIPRVSETAR